MVFDDDTEAAHPFGLQPAELAQAHDPMPPTPKAPARGLSPEFDRSILFPHLLMELVEKGEQSLIRDGARTGGAVSPGVVAAPTDGQGRTEPRYPMVRFLSPDKCISHVDSLAKYAAAFFKMSRSSVTRASRRTSLKPYWSSIYVASTITGKMEVPPG